MMLPTDNMPRGPVANPRSTSMDVPDGYTYRMRAWREQAMEEALATLRTHKEYANAQMYIDMLEGRQWDKKRPQYRSPFINNRMMKARLDSLALLTDIRPTLEVTSRVRAYERQANANAMAIRHEWIHNNFEVELISVCDLAFLGTAFAKLTASMPGSLGMTACGFDQVLPLVPGRHIQQSLGVMYRTYKPLSYFITRFGADACKGLERYQVSAMAAAPQDLWTRPDGIDEITWNALSPQMKYKLGMRNTGSGGNRPGGVMYPAIELQEFYIDDPSVNESSGEVIVKDPRLALEEHNYHYRVRRGQRLFPRKRLIVFAGDKLLYDGPSVYWHGLYPFAKLEFNPIPWGHGGMSRYRNLVPLNKAVNEISAGIIDMVRKAVNPPLIVREGAVSPAAWNAFFPDMPGNKLKLAGNANPAQDLRYGDVPNLPSYVFLFLMQYLIPEYREQAGLLDITGLGKKKQIPGGDTIEAMRDLQQTQIRLESKFLEAFLKDCGVQAMSNVFQFFTAKQRLRILGEDGITAEDFDYDPGVMVPSDDCPREDHWRQFAISVSGGGSLLGSSKDREKQMMMVLFKMGAIDKETLLENLEVPNIGEVLERIKASQAEMAAAGAMGGPGGDTPRLTRGQRNGMAV